MLFAGIDNTDAISFSLSDYLALIQWSGRHVDANKAGYLDAKEPDVLKELGIDEETWLEAIINFRREYRSNMILRRHAHSYGCRWHKGGH